MNADRTPADPQLAEALRRLQDPPAPAALFDRILRSRAQRRWRRRLGLACLVLAGGLLWLPAGPPGERGDRETGATAAAADRGLELWLLDRRLQAAYEHGADSEQLARLWQARANLLAGPAAIPDAMRMKEVSDGSVLEL
ncbi:MAG: hypothetical protein KatS3mg126_0435 [Lysobacteraceae bacterium]|nr:MAG: hypothetical protein KatS3mg126_0435 [Xanthomonadaceae bacterium]